MNRYLNRSREEIQSQVDAFLAKGGHIDVAPAGMTIHEAADGLWHCRCGCHGNYTDHSMRAGESGRCASIIIQD